MSWVSVWPSSLATSLTRAAWAAAQSRTRIRAAAVLMAFPSEDPVEEAGQEARAGGLVSVPLAGVLDARVGDLLRQDGVVRGDVLGADDAGDAQDLLLAVDLHFLVALDEQVAVVVDRHDAGR